MKKLFKILLLLWCVLPVLSYALIPTITGYRVQLNQGGDPGVGSSASAACSQAVLAWVANSGGILYYGGGTPYVSAGVCYGTGYRDPDNVPWVALSGTVTTTNSCPANSTASGGSCLCTPPKVEDPTHTSCIDANACIAKQGTTVTRNFTSGYSTKQPTVSMYPSYKADGTPAPGGYLGAVNMGDITCVDSCQATLGTVVNAWASTEPTATGFYRFSFDYDVTFASVGTACTATAAQNATLASSFAVPPCVGFVGQVNGKVSCIPKVPDGSSRGVSNAQANLGNPTAGTTGGSGNIPSSGGNGGNGGGPVGSSDGGLLTPDGKVAKPPTGTASATPPSNPASGVEAACGAPGEPRCAIDESGTPTDADSSIAKSADKFKTDMDSLRATVSGSSDKGFFSGWGTLFSAPAFMPCAPISLPAFQGGASLGSFDACPVVEGVRSVMGYIWSLTAMIMCLGMIRKVI